MHDLLCSFFGFVFVFTEGALRNLGNHYFKLFPPVFCKIVKINMPGAGLAFFLSSLLWFSYSVSFEGTVYSE